MKTRHRRAARALGAFLLCLGLGTPPATAQWMASVTGSLLVPLTGPLVREVGGVNGAPVPYPTIEKWLVNGVMLSARATRFPQKGPAIEGSLGTGLTSVATRDSLNRVRQAKAVWILSSVRLPLRLNRPKANGVGFFAAPGLGYQWYGGPGWNGYGNRGVFAGVLSLGARAQVKPRSRFWFRLDMEDYVSHHRFSLGGARLEARLHHTLIFSLGLSFSRKRLMR